MFLCKLCEIETVYVVSLCDKCRRVKHLLNLYKDRVYQVLEEVLVRQPTQQQNKIHVELVKEKINLETFEKKIEDTVKHRLRSMDTKK
tara:strand:- start:6350 stop:6613 length:264 start_codon:yes stop_codon:yes gene_type:complete